MKPRSGHVWYEARRVGALRADERGRLRFRYDPEWLERGFPVSITLPLSAGTAEVDAHPFFEGLLPEGGARRRLVRRHRLEEQDDAGLLFAIGEDCAGALSILPEDETPTGATDPPVVLSAQDLSLIVQSHGEALPLPPGRRRRVSLAGAQDKVPVLLDDGAMCLPDRQHPSSHILKLETIRKVCVAEMLGSSLAARMGLDVVAIEYRELDVDATPYLFIERYDRRRDDEGELHRLHQEDAAQALGRTSDAKYEEDGGPSLGDVAELIRRHTVDPIDGIHRLRDWHLFNYLAGNSDGHAKNLSLLYASESPIPVLAPFYDLVCIEMLNRIGAGTYDRSMAFRVGDHTEPERITQDDWRSLAASIGVPARTLLARLEEMAERMPAEARATREQFAARHGDNQVYDRFEEAVRDRCSWTLRSVFGRG